MLLRIDKATRTITYAEALDVALAWGWIDSQKRAIDATAWLQRLTPRTATSPWSKITRAKAEALIRYRIQTAKLPATRTRRIAQLVALCAAHETLHPPRKKRAPRARS